MNSENVKSQSLSLSLSLQTAHNNIIETNRLTLLPPTVFLFQTC